MKPLLQINNYLRSGKFRSKLNYIQVYFFQPDSYSGNPRFLIFWFLNLIFT
jgi:hypothetical protein